MFGQEELRQGRPRRHETVELLRLDRADRLDHSPLRPVGPEHGGLAGHDDQAPPLLKIVDGDVHRATVVADGVEEPERSWVGEGAVDAVRVDQRIQLLPLVELPVAVVLIITAKLIDWHNRWNRP